MTGIDDLRTDLARALSDRPGWVESCGAWRRTESSGPGEKHTVRHLSIHSLGSGRGQVHGVKNDGIGQTTDVAEFADVAAAIAWVETPRSHDTVQHRAFMADMEAYARRNDVDLAGLKGVKADSGWNPKRQRFDVVEFDAPVGKVRLTQLGDGQWRISRNRKNATITASGDRQAVHAALRAEIERLTAAQEVPA